MSNADPALADELLRLRLFEGETREAAEWLASHMRVQLYEPGEIFASEGDPVTEFILILEGELQWQIHRLDSLLVAPAGIALGVLPFSRLKTWGGRGWASQPTRLAFMDAAHLRELVYRAPVLAQHLVSEMTDRAREFTRLEEGAHRLLSLGKLSAGLAHELNNPAAAAVRSAARLRAVFAELREHSVAIHSEVIPERGREAITKLAEALTECETSPGVDALERADRESELADWLESRGAPAELAAGLADIGFSTSQLEPLAQSASAYLFVLALRALIAEHEILCLTRELEEASRRISELVQAVKVYSYMDQNPVADVDIELGIDATLRMFQHRFKSGVHVERRFDGALPKIRANGGALNQIWTNLIDNALDALEELPSDISRRLSVRTCAEPDMVLVEVEDNGPGIPLEVQNRMFEPFFTTKPVGDGTGLGLDIVQRIVREHKGAIRVESSPGRTVFQVRFPLHVSSPRTYL